MILSKAAATWTGGQYSVYRWVLGLYLLFSFVPALAGLVSGVPSGGHLEPYALVAPSLLAWFEPSWGLGIVLGVGVVGAVALALGLWSRAAAIVLLGIWAWFGFSHGASGFRFWPVGLLLGTFAVQAGAPFGAWTERGRTDPRGDWRMDARVFVVLWGALGLGYAYEAVVFFGAGGALPSGMAGAPLVGFGGVAVGLSVLQLLFIPLCLSVRLRPWVWGGLLGIQVLKAAGGVGDASGGMLLLHLFTYVPGWLAPRPGPIRLFYDGSCGLCHRAVRFVIAEDRGQNFVFIALADVGRFLPKETITSLPDSLVTEVEGVVASRSAAVITMLKHLGGLWRVAAILLSLVPAPTRDLAYDRVAAVRHRLFARPQTACPVLPPDVRSRFLS